MTAKKPEPRVRIARSETTGGLVARYPWQTYRFMFQDGTTIDVRAMRDDSDLREAVLAFAKAERIAGVAVVPEPPKETT